MSHPYQLKLRSNVHLIEDGDDLLLACADGRGLRNRQSGAGIRALLNALTHGGQSTEQLIQCALAAEAKADISRLYFLLSNLESKGLLNYTLAEEDTLFATLESISPSFHFVDSQNKGTFRLSRFACLRRDGDKMIVESPCGHARLIFHETRLTVLPALLAIPRSMDGLEEALPDFDVALLEAMLSLLINAGAVISCDADGSTTEDSDAGLRQWEFHDLLFHTRSRSGRHDYPMGGTYRFKGEIPHAPALKAPMSEDRIILDRPASEIKGPDFFEVLEARRSQREPGEAALTLPQLAAFLWRSARVKMHAPADSDHPGSYEMTLRPCPSGGAIHELELYLTISRCSGLKPGLYHYNPMAHELEYLSDLGKKQQAMVQDAMNSSGLKQAPDVLISVAARFGRVAWKYEGVAYALVQKNTGCLYQQMYLVATALKLSPCALGAGNSEHFSQATGLDYFEETAVGDFMLSSASI